MVDEVYIIFGFQCGDKKVDYLNVADVQRTVDVQRNPWNFLLKVTEKHVCLWLPANQISKGVKYWLFLSLIFAKLAHNELNNFVKVIFIMNQIFNLLFKELFFVFVFIITDETLHLFQFDLVWKIFKLDLWKEIDDFFLKNSDFKQKLLFADQINRNNWVRLCSHLLRVVLLEER